MPQGIYAQKTWQYHFEIHSNSFWNKHPHGKPFDNARLTKLFWVQNNLTLSLQHGTWNPRKHIEMAIVTWFRVCSLNSPMLDSGLCCQVDFRNLTIEHESTPFKTPEMISVGSPFLEARSTSSILQSFGPAVVSNNCSFSGQNITTILTYKKHYTTTRTHHWLVCQKIAAMAVWHLRPAFQSTFESRSCYSNQHPAPAWNANLHQRPHWDVATWEISRDVMSMFPLYDYSKHSNLLDKDKEENVHTQYIHISLDIYIY